jgi:hypothetical protein
LGLVVVAILRGENASAIETALTGAGLDLVPFQLIGPDESTRGPARTLSGTNLLTGSGTVGVPGINADARRIELFRNESLPDRLGDLEIPDSELDNYLEALAAGNSIAAYFAKPETVERVVEIFKGAGLARVTRY